MLALHAELRFDIRPSEKVSLSLSDSQWDEMKSDRTERSSTAAGTGSVGLRPSMTGVSEMGCFHVMCYFASWRLVRYERCQCTRTVLLRHRANARLVFLSPPLHSALVLDRALSFTPSSSLSSSSMSSMSSTSFSHLSCPTWGWEAYAGISAVIYATAIFGMTGLNNNYAACGWGATAAVCVLWYLYFRNERRAEPLRCPLHVTNDKTAPATSHQQQHSVPFLTPTRRLPFYCTLTSITAFTVIALLLLTLACTFLVLSISRHAPLTGQSTWMAFISFTMSVKCSLQLIASLCKGRRRWLVAAAEHQADDRKATLIDAVI